MGRQAQERASRPKAPKGSHPPPRHQPYRHVATMRRYKAPLGPLPPKADHPTQRQLVIIGMGQWTADFVRSVRRKTLSNI
jgi:hypothetical protein